MIIGMINPFQTMILLRVMLNHGNYSYFDSFSIHNANKRTIYLTHFYKTIQDIFFALTFLVIILTIYYIPLFIYVYQKLSLFKINLTEEELKLKIGI